MRNQRDFVTPQVKSLNYGLESTRVLGTKNVGNPSKWFEDKEPVDSFKQPLRDGNLNHVLANFVKRIYRTYRLLVEIEEKQSDDHSLWDCRQNSLPLLVEFGWINWLLFPLKSGGLVVNWFARILFHSGTEFWWQSLTRTCFFIL